MPNNRDITGERIGTFTVEEFVRWKDLWGGRRLRIWRFRCDCGATLEAPSHQIESGVKRCRSCSLNGNITDLSGQTFGRLKVTGSDASRDGHAFWHVECVDCGKTGSTLGHRLPVRTKCLCEWNSVTHGMTGTPTYRAYRSMLNRCYYQKAINYDIYGGRGIRVCDLWRESFDNFLADMGEKPDGMSLDRIDPDGNYEPANCKWSNRVEQNRNTRRARKITWNGKTLHIHEWAKRLGWSENVIALRLHRGWPIERIMTTPPRKR